jgi:hypothetical protein
MDRDDFRFGLFMVGFIAAIFVVIGLIVSPLAYFDGQAKSRWIKETKGIDIPWYEATFLVVEINSVDAEISSR